MHYKCTHLEVGNLAIPIPIGPIISAIRRLASIVTKCLFLPTYRRSHAIWVDHHRLGTHWTKCGEHLEYSLYLAHATDPEPKISKIAIRATGQDLHRVSMVFEAESDVARYQEPIVLHNVDPKAIVWTLTNIAYQNLSQVNEKAGIRFSLDEYRFRNVQVTLDDGTEDRAFDTMQTSLTHTWHWNSDWNYRWGRYWNLDAAKWAKQQMALYWRFGFGMPQAPEYGPSGTSASFNLTQLWVAATRPLSRVMATNMLLTLQFWLAIWSGMFILNNESELQWRWKQAERSNSQ